MNNSFNFGRMFAVIKKEIRESWQTILLTWASLVGILTLVSLFKAYFSQYVGPEWFPNSIRDALIPIIYVTLFIFSAIAASSVFKKMRNKSMRLQALMLPASQAEKFTAAWLIAIPGFFISFIAAVYASQLLAAAIFPIFRSTELSYPIINWFSFVGNCFSGSEIASFVIGLLFIQSFFLLGGIVWAKNPLIKTFASLMAIWIIYSLCLVWVEYATLRDDVYFVEQSMKSMDTLTNVLLIVTALLTLFNYALAYLRLREAEINNRW